MSDHTLCDKCGQVIDKAQPYLQVVVTELVSTDGTPTTATPATVYDYHTNHAPKFAKAKPEPTEPVEEPEPEPEPET